MWHTSSLERLEQRTTLTSHSPTNMSPAPEMDALSLRNQLDHTIMSKKIITCIFYFTSSSLSPFLYHFSSFCFHSPLQLIIHVPIFFQSQKVEWHWLLDKWWASWRRRWCHNLTPVADDCRRLPTTAGSGLCPWSTAVWGWQRLQLHCQPGEFRMVIWENGWKSL